MKKAKFFRCIVALMLSVVMCMAFGVTAFAVDIPYKNCYVTGTQSYTYYIDTRNFSGYSNHLISKFSVQTQNLNSSTTTYVSVSYGSTDVGYAFLTGNEKLENIAFWREGYWPAGVYTINITITDYYDSGWVGVWLY